MNELDRRASDAGKQVSSTAGHLRKIAEELRSDDLSRPAAQLADRGAQTLDNIGRYLEQTKGDKLLSDAERFGRERPWVLATAGVALGLAGSRMLKASAARRSRNDEYDGDYAGSTSGAYSAGQYRPAAPATGSMTSASPVSSDAAPYKASSQGTSPAAAPYPSGGAYGASSSPTGVAFDPMGEAPISKSAEAKRLTNSDGS